MRTHLALVIAFGLAACAPEPTPQTFGLSGRDAVVAIEGGQSQFCALTERGKLFCWGADSPRRATRVWWTDRHRLLPKLAQIDLNSELALGLTDDGDVYAWG
jgi:alpha-tubulin suppressor-like RCC1 family protein